MTEAKPIRPRDRDAILRSLRAGVVPRQGLQHVQVGRVGEITALLRDIESIADGGSTLRLVIGEYGSGKTFFLHLVRSIALEKRLVTAHADLSPDRRLFASGGQARLLYAELMRNLATRSKPDGGGLPSVVERFVSSALQEAREEGADPEAIIHRRLEDLSEMVGGYDFAQVVAAYWKGHDTGDEVLKSNAVRWLRAEYSTRTEARQALGLRTIIDDANAYDHLKLMARFVRLAGYAGLFVCLDEMVNLFKLASTKARRSNYEQVLRILNDTLQGISTGVGFLFCGTPEFLSDPRRGLYSYPALETRLAESRYATGDVVDFSGPVVRLANLTPEDLYVLLEKLRHVYAGGEPERYLVPDEALTAFMDHCSNRIGEAYFRTPRSTIREFVGLLSVLEQNPGLAWDELIEGLEVRADAPDEADAPSGDDGEDGDDGEPPAAGSGELASFQL